MKSTKRQYDPLEETMENPDLPPLAPVEVPSAHEIAAAPRRGQRFTLALGTVVLVLAVLGLRLAG